MGNEGSFYVAFERSGGFAGMVITTEISSDTLLAEDAKTLRSFIDNSGILKDGFKVAAPKPDRFVYKLTVEADGIKKTIEIGEVDITPQMRPMIDDLTKRAKSR